MDSSWTDGEDEEEKQEEEMHFVKQLNRHVLPKSVFIYRRDTKQEPSGITSLAVVLPLKKAGPTPRRKY